MDRLTRAEWRDWLDHPGTQQFFQELDENREEALQRMAVGLFSEEPGKQNILIGMINALTKILEKQHGESYDDGE
jgi:hypothetical protein